MLGKVCNYFRKACVQAVHVSLTRESLVCRCLADANALQHPALNFAKCCIIMCQR